MTRARWRVVALLAILVSAIDGQAARAAETAIPTQQAVSYRLDWIPYIDPNDLPPPAQRQAVCVVDTGLRTTPDTPPATPNGPIVARLSLDGDSGEPQGEAPPHLHGTRMAMAAVASQNGWGTVGIWPQGRVISVRATVNGETSFRGDGYYYGARECLRYGSANGVPLAAINLSLGSPTTLSTIDAAHVVNAVADAHRRGSSVVGAAGNTAGATGSPASTAGVFAVAAGDPGGGLCPSASFDALVAVLGPGCHVDTANPMSGTPYDGIDGGSSTATIVASTLVALLRTLRPDASRELAEQWIASSARTVDGRRVLDGESAARAAGLGAVVDRAKVRTPKPVRASPVTAAAPRTRKRLPRPHIRVRWSRGALFVRTSNRPAKARLSVRAVYLRGEFAIRRQVKRSVASSRVKLRLRSGPPRRLIVSFTPADPDGALPSLPTIRNRRSSGAWGM